MKPVRFLVPTAQWVLRLSAILFIYTYFFDTFISFKLQSLMFYVSAVFVSGGILLLAGGFLRSAKMTVIVSLLLFLLSLTRLFVAYKSGGADHDFASMLILSAIFLNFLANGNRN